MKPDWDALADEFKDSQKVLIADVDCTAAGKSLCERMDVRGYPTIKSFSPPDDTGEAYEGGRDLASLRTFAENLGPGCSLDAKENCKPSDLETLEKYAGMSQARRDAKMNKLTNAIKKAEAEHEAVQKELQAKYEASNTKFEKLKEEVQPVIKLLKAATPSAK